MLNPNDSALNNLILLFPRSVISDFDNFVVKRQLGR